MDAEDCWHTILAGASLFDATQGNVGLLVLVRSVGGPSYVRCMNPVPRPQGVTLKALTKSILSTTWKNKQAEYADRVEGTLEDVYSSSKIPQRTSAAWQRARRSRSSKK